MTVHKIIFILSAVFILTVQTASGKDNAPHEISGFKLGSSIDEYEFISYQNYLKEVIIDNIGGFRKGIISYGVCDHPGEIVKIRLKYNDSSEKFYKQLFSRYKEKFGKPDEFTGDAFGIVLSWKWEFVDKDNNRITLTLQHNPKNTDENIGNVVKLAMPDRIESERKCFTKSCAERKVNCPLPLAEENWMNMIPR